MDDWYNDSLPRYPRVLIQRETNPTVTEVASNRTNGNVIRIRVHGRRSEGEEVEPPRVTVHRYEVQSTQPASNVQVVPVPVQFKRMASSPIANTAHAHRLSTYKTQTSGFFEPIKALPLNSPWTDLNMNQPEAVWSKLMPNSGEKEFPHVQSDFSTSFDKFTSEYTSFVGTKSSDQNRESSNYAFRRHASEDINRQRHRSVGSQGKMQARASSPSLFVSTYSQAAGRHKSSTRSTNDDTSENKHMTAGPASKDTASILRAKQVIDRVLKNLDNMKGHRNTIVNDDTNSIKTSSKGLEGDLGSMPFRDDSDSGYCGSGDSANVGFTWSSVEIQENVRRYNSTHRNSQFTQVGEDAETFQGDIQIYLCLEDPVNMLLNIRPSPIFHGAGKTEERITASTTIPSNTITRLHITSKDTTETVVEQLLNKFSIVESPKHYGLYEQTLKNETEVKLRKAAVSERPLLNFLRWNTESQEQKRFILKETHDSDIVWESFSIPELSNFLMMLKMERDERVKEVKRKYTSYKHNLETRLKELTPSV
ncbi:uncharacterized protein [Watersipora subatra]|uniref:uncharacterized protein isoform X2 n=1 Tax=Watersipora subatra TaxID=2589382 RepID=UPI00355BCF10